MEKKKRMFFKSKYSIEEEQNIREDRFNTISLAISIGILPPLWAVISQILGVKFGGVALVCAALFVANGNKTKDIIKISVGFFISVVWGCIALYFIKNLPWNNSVNTFITLCSMGALAVVIASSRLKKIIYLPSWLCGWAITNEILSQMYTGLGIDIPISIAISMVVGVIYVGAGVLVFGKLINKLLAFIYKIDDSK